MASVTLNGVTYTDDSNASTGMANGGHRVRFVPCLSNFLAEAAIQIALAADQVDLAAAQAASAAGQVPLAAAQVALAADQVALAADQADLAALQAAAASGSASAAATAASTTVYAGAWADLTGALVAPASVSHNGQFWALTESLADVTAAEPGVDARWYVMGGISESISIAISFLMS